MVASERDIIVYIKNDEVPQCDEIVYYLVIITTCTHVISGLNMDLEKGKFIESAIKSGQ